jgi:hypothetical protein
VWWPQLPGKPSVAQRVDEVAAADEVAVTAEPLRHPMGVTGLQWSPGLLEKGEPGLLSRGWHSCRPSTPDAELVCLPTWGRSQAVGQRHISAGTPQGMDGCSNSDHSLWPLALHAVQGNKPQNMCDPHVGPSVREARVLVP